MEDDILATLKDHIEALALPVGFIFSGPATPIDETSPPERTLIWESSFAVLALIPLSSTEMQALTMTQETAREWMWRRLTKDEYAGKFLDGYLLFALPAEPNESERSKVQVLELDTAVCRKHVIWPSANNQWGDALWSVTVLGLPPVQPSVATSIATPELPSVAMRALELYEQLDNYETAAERLREEARSTTDEEASDAS